MVSGKAMMRATGEQRQRVTALAVAAGARTALALAAVLPAVAQAAQFNLQTPQTPIAQKIDLHMLITWICVVIFVGVFGVMFWSVFKHRKSVGHQAAQFHENTTSSSSGPSCRSSSCSRWRSPRPAPSSR